MSNNDEMTKNDEQAEQDMWFILSQTALARIWENEEDDIYAELVDD